MSGGINRFKELIPKPFDRLRANGLNQHFLNSPDRIAMG
jgi:hypothetical protein